MGNSMGKKEIAVTKTIDARELILGILLEVNKNGEYSHIAIRNVLEKYQYLEKKDRAFIQTIAEGTLEQMITIDYIISRFSSVSMGKMKPVIRNLLRMSVYQLRYMDQIPASAVCNEAVKLAEKKGFRNLKGFVNGILRTISREQEHIEMPEREENILRFLSINYSMPEWIVEEWISLAGVDGAERMLQESIRKSNTIIRCAVEKLSPEQLILQLEQEGVSVRKAPYLEEALEIWGYDHLNALESFRNGCFYVQDISSMLVAHIAAPKEGSKVIDVCASPGGKAIHMAELLKGTGSVEARDLTEYKVSMLRGNIDRTGLKNITARQQDALEPSGDDFEKADVVICDLPCSGLGVISRKKDIKYRMTKEAMNELVILQQKILNNVSDFVKPEGVLIYSTCTVNIAENLDNARWFEENHPFHLESIEEYLPQELQGETGKEGYIQLLPGIHRCDGFFVARFRKNKGC